MQNDKANQNQKRRRPKKEFSVLKWVIFPAMTVVLAGIICWFNITVFGWRDGGPYIGIALAITFFAICIAKYTGAENRGLSIAAFCFEIVLLLALIVNAAFSLSVQREMSIARQGQYSAADLKGLDRRTRWNITRNQRNRRSADTIFSDNETLLFWIFVGELLAFATAYFSLLAIAQVIEKKDEASKLREAEDYVRRHGGRERYYRDDDDSLPSRNPEVEEARASGRMRGRVATRNLDSRQIPTQENHVATQDEEWDPMRILRANLKVIAEGLPRHSFKADQNKKGVWIRLYQADSPQHESLVHKKLYDVSILNDAVNRRHQFAGLLRGQLRRDGFIK